jgi:hypothetical protein
MVAQVVVVVQTQALSAEVQQLLTKEEMVAQAKATLAQELLELVVAVVVLAVLVRMVLLANLVQVSVATAVADFHPQ